MLERWRSMIDDFKIVLEVVISLFLPFWSKAHLADFPKTCPTLSSEQNILTWKPSIRTSPQTFSFQLSNLERKIPRM